MLIYRATGTPLSKSIQLSTDQASKRTEIYDERFSHQNPDAQSTWADCARTDDCRSTPPLEKQKVLV